MWWALACSTVPSGNGDPTDSGTTGSTSDTQTNDDDTGGPTDPWPDTGLSRDSSVSLVCDGSFVSPGATVTLDTAPAGVDQHSTMQCVVTNRTASTLALSTSEGDWLSSSGIEVQSDLPGNLDPEQSAAITLGINPVAWIEATTEVATLSVPGTTMQATVEAVIPRPLRMVFVGEGGYTLVSDSYGEDFSYEHVPKKDGGETRHTVTWGEGLFFRGFASGGDWSDPGVYESSPDGITWTEAVANDDFWPSQCTYALERFVCAWDDSLAWSESGTGVIHGTTSYDQLLNGITFTGSHLVVVGRSTHIRLSEDGQSFSEEIELGDDDGLYQVAYGDGVLVAVGGSDRHYIATSTDGGFSWSSQVVYDAQYARLYQVAWLDGSFLVTGNGGDELLQSTDGFSWSPVKSKHEGAELLGVANGWFFAAETPWQGNTTLLRSRDGVDWEELYTVESGYTVTAMAIEGWP